jgi:hypothetical protein
MYVLSRRISYQKEELKPIMKKTKHPSGYSIYLTMAAVISMLSEKASANQQ